MSRSFEDIEARIAALGQGGSEAVPAARELLALGEEVLETWIAARGDVPTDELKEGFRILALHRQGAKGDPSFNACRETARELVYHYNLITLEPDDPATASRVAMMSMIAGHLCLFVGGKMEVAGLGEFCCSSRPVRAGGG
ncbi:MAG: hypothetical protein KDJ37_05365 [Hyphomicrobiaceae bacterium]|nr:hypothetical protein [Hyphomicrobiaceae bacterium]